MSRTKLPIRSRARKPPLAVAGILKWADEFHVRHGRWPNMDDGLITGTADQTWGAVNRSLEIGTRGLPGGTSLAKLLLKHRGRRHWHMSPDLTIHQIVAWADAFHRRTGRWPQSTDAVQIPDAPEGTTWVAVQLALKRGRRGLTGGRSLAEVLELHRGVRNRLNVQELTEELILAWADDHHAKTGRWPKYPDGVIAAAPQDTWHAIDAALWKGTRGLPGDDSLAKLLARCRGVRNKSELPHLTLPQIHAWVDAHVARTGQLPTRSSGPIPEAPGETWSGVSAALTVGMRGLPGSDSLAKLLAREFGYRNQATIPPLALKTIKAWVLAHHQATGEWPKYTSGAIRGVPGETWGAVENALRKGRRGLPSGSSVAKVVRECQKT